MIEKLHNINKHPFYDFTMARISASILGFYFDAKKRKETDSVMIDRINAALKAKDKEMNILHFDIEDGIFVNHKSFKPGQIRKINSTKKKEMHFMVVNYKKYLKDYFNLADMFIFHQEVLRRDFPKTIDFLKKNKRYAGISINPETHVDEIKYLDKIDLVLVMSVNPGLPGQKFIDSSINKVKKLYEIRKQRKLRYVIEVDGGINTSNMKKCIAAGADILVMGTGFFKK
jgi:ribulose-phosphate 3-epimerase